MLRLFVYQNGKKVKEVAIYNSAAFARIYWDSMLSTEILFFF